MPHTDTTKKGPVRGPFAFGSRGLLDQTARDVAEHVLDLVAKNNQNYDDHDRDQDEDKGVLDHTLPFLTVEQFAQTQVEAVQHGFHLPSERLRSVWHRPRITGSRAETENASALVNDRPAAEALNRMKMREHPRVKPRDPFQATVIRQYPLDVIADAGAF